MCFRQFFLTFLLIYCLILSACSGGSTDNTTDSDSSTGTELPLKLELFGGLAPGNTDDSSNIEYYYNISLQKLDDQQYVGTSMIRPVNSTDELAVLNVEASFDGVSLMLEEMSLVNIDNASGMNEEFYNCLRSSSLTVNEGEASGQWTSTSGCASGKMYLSTVSPTTFDGLPNCPCKFDETLDGKIEDDGTWSDGFDPSWYHPGASKEIRWTPRNGGPGQQCTYDEKGDLITGGLAAGTPDNHSPSSNIFGHTALDVAPLYVYNCKQYLSMFPPNNGNSCPSNIIYPVTGESPSQCNATINYVLLKGWGWGDPHLITLDGVAYDMQAVGEFVFVRSVEGDFEIQIRTHPWRNLTTAAIISAVATRMKEDQFGIYYDSVNAGLLCRLNGVEQGCSFNTLNLDGGSITRNGLDFYFLWHDGSRMNLSANIAGGFLNPSVSLMPERFDLVEGLLGNANSEPEDDMQSPSGEIFELRLPFSKFYSEYVEGWRITNTSSLFDYASGESTETYTNRDFPASMATHNDLSESEYDYAFQICKEKLIQPSSVQFDACLLDVGLTGESTFADASLFNARIEERTDLFPDATIKYGFDFGGGRPFFGSTTTECGNMTLETTNTEPFSSSAFRNQLSGLPALVTFNFEYPVTSFHLELAYVRSDEYLSNLNIEATTLSGTLIREGQKITTSLKYPSDSGSGIVSWFDINSDEIEFVIGGPTGTALSIQGYDIECAM